MSTNKPVEIEELFGDLETASDDRNWLVVYTKPRREKKLAEYSFRKEIHYYLPLKDSLRIYRNRKILFTKPLFPGYLFVNCNREEKRTLLISGHIVNFLKVIDETGLLDDLKQIYSGKVLGGKLKETEYLEAGTRVEIISGTFTGLTGVVKDQNNVAEVHLQINLLKQAVSITASTDQIRILR